MTDTDRILKRLGQIERRIIDIDTRLAQIQAVDIDTTDRQGVTHHDGTTHAPGTGRLGGTATRDLSPDAIAALDALDE